MSRELNELLDSARLRSGHGLQLDRFRTDLVDLVGGVGGDHRRAAPRHEFVPRSNEKAVGGDWDSFRIERVLTNLLGKAITYSPEGSQVLVRLHKEQSPDGRWAVLQVVDHGLGIPAGELPSVFDRFFRASNVVDRAPASASVWPGSRPSSGCTAGA